VSRLQIDSSKPPAASTSTPTTSPTSTTSQTSTRTATDEPTTRHTSTATDGQPGFGWLASMGVLAGAAAYVLRRATDGGAEE